MSQEICAHLVDVQENLAAKHVELCDSLPREYHYSGEEGSVGDNTRDKLEVLNELIMQSVKEQVQAYNSVHATADNWSSIGGVMLRHSYFIHHSPHEQERLKSRAHTPAFKWWADMMCHVLCRSAFAMGLEPTPTAKRDGKEIDRWFDRGKKNGADWIAARIHDNGARRLAATYKKLPGRKKQFPNPLHNCPVDDRRRTLARGYEMFMCSTVQPFSVTLASPVDWWFYDLREQKSLDVTAAEAVVFVAYHM